MAETRVRIVRSNRFWTVFQALEDGLVGQTCVVKGQSYRARTKDLARAMTSDPKPET